MQTKSIKSKTSKTQRLIKLNLNYKEQFQFHKLH